MVSQIGNSYMNINNYIANFVHTQTKTVATTNVFACTEAIEAIQHEEMAGDTQRDLYTVN